MDGELHPISIDDDFTRFVLCFPYSRCDELSYRVEELVRNGFTYFVEKGNNVLGYKIIGKGYSSINVLAINKYYGLGLIKIRRIDSRRKTLEYEGMIIDFLDITGYVPRLYMWSKDYVFREYLHDCLSIDKALLKSIEEKRVNDAIGIIRKTLSALYLIDKLGIDHSELNRPYNHIYWCREYNVKIIDWESSRLRRKPHNLTSFVSFLVYRFKKKPFSELFEDVRSEVFQLLKKYKTNPSAILLKTIIRLLEKQLVLLHS